MSSRRPSHGPADWQIVCDRHNPTASNWPLRPCLQFYICTWPVENLCKYQEFLETCFPYMIRCRDFGIREIMLFVGKPKGRSRMICTLELHWEGDINLKKDFFSTNDYVRKRWRYCDTERNRQTDNNKYQEERKNEDTDNWKIETWKQICSEESS